MIKTGKYESKPSREARVHFTGDFWELVGQTLVKSDIDKFDGAAEKHELEKVCRSPWSEMNILSAPFVLLMKH